MYVYLTRKLSRNFFIIQVKTCNSEEKALQELSVSHIKTQEYVEEYSRDHDAIDREFIKSIHRVFYLAEGMDRFTTIKKDSGTLKMIPGEFRTDEVAVGKHIAPSHNSIDKVKALLQNL